MSEQHIFLFSFPMKRHYPNSTKQQYHHMATIDKPQKAKIDRSPNGHARRVIMPDVCCKNPRGNHMAIGRTRLKLALYSWCKHPSLTSFISTLFPSLLPTSSFFSRLVAFLHPRSHCPSFRTAICRFIRRFSSWRAPTPFAIRFGTFLQRPCPWSLPSPRRASKPRPKRLGRMIQRTYLVSGERVSIPWVQRRPSPTGKSSLR